MTNPTRDIHAPRLADAWAVLQAHSDLGNPLEADASRLAFETAARDDIHFHPLESRSARLTLAKNW